ncbi:LuxR C-terminal-related transcriptional regulator [Streptomyces niveiscabiei]|uniref:response regulator transcription factor n=1 Tax=Streptomyces TaxID=1883 RepID=UPI0006EB532E|nr:MULTISPECIES: response regulator transcription factor [Streptomyces]
MALVSHRAPEPTVLAGLANRPVREPRDLRAQDDVLLFYGTGMAQELERFSAGAVTTLPPAVLLAPRLDWDDVHLALRHGAACYLLEKRRPAPLADVLACACRGVSSFDPSIVAELFRRATTSEVREAPDRCSALPRLTSRERQIMELLASGNRVCDIAEQLFLSTRTVRNNLGRVYGKLGARNQAEAILYWLGRLEPSARRDATTCAAAPVGVRGGARSPA